MRFNFKKISAVLTSAVMLGSSLGIAAAANYPDPFIKGGVADVAIVYGTGEGVSVLDAVQAGNVQTDLQSKMSTTSSSSTASVSGGDSVKIEKSSTKLNVGDNLTTVWSASITNTDLPTLLASGTYTNYENTEYAYTQRIALGTGLRFTEFASSQYKDSTPSIGVDIAASTLVLNYTLDWTTNPESDVVSGDLDDIEKTNIPILGKTYYILDLDNSTLDMTLLDSAVSEIVKEGEKVSMKVGDKTYEVSIEYVGTSTTRIKVGDETTSSLANGGTYKLKDGTYIGIRDIMYTSKTGDISKVELSLGKGKLELKNNANVKLNEANVRDLYGRVIRGTAGSGGKEKLERINIEWIQYEEGFFTPNTELTMPGFGNLKFTMGNLSFYANEKTSVEYGSDSYFNLKTTIKDGALTIPLVYGSTTTGNFTGLGQDSTRRLAITNNTRIYYQAQASYNEGFIVSWNNSREGETYYMKAAVNQDGTTGVNKTTFTNRLTNKDICTDLEAGQTCTVGNVVLNVDDVTYLSATAKNVTFHLDAGGSFNRVITAQGLSVWLPYDNLGANTTAYGAVNFAANGTEVSDVHHTNTGSIGIWFAEEDKDKTLGSGQMFNMTLDMTGTAGSSMKTTVSDIDYEYVAGSSSDGKPISSETVRTPNSGIWQTTLLSEMATKILWNKPSGATQYSAEVYYHGKEVYGDVFLAAPAASVTSSSSGTSTVSQLGNVLVKDSEIESVKTKNLVVIGGSCINSVAAKALGVSTHTCGAAFTEKTKVGTGQFLIQSVADAYTTGKIALVVAGYDAADTQNAATFLTKKDVDTTAGKKYVGTSATEASLQVA